MAQFLKGFKKDRAGQVKRVQGLVIPTFKLNNNHVEPIHNVSSALSDLLNQLSLMMDQKIVDAQKSTSDLFVNMSDEIYNLKKGKSIDGTYSLDILKPTPVSIPEQIMACRWAILQGKRHHHHRSSRARLDRSDCCGGSLPSVTYTDHIDSWLDSP